MSSKLERIVSWNCRGAASREFLVEVKEILRQYRPQMLIILEPQVSGAVADKVCKSLGRSKWIRAKALGFSRGIWILWEEGHFEVELKAAGR